MKEAHLTATLSDVHIVHVTDCWLSDFVRWRFWDFMFSCFWPSLKLSAKKAKLVWSAWPRNKGRFNQPECDKLSLTTQYFSIFGVFKRFYTPVHSAKNTPQGLWQWSLCEFEHIKNHMQHLYYVISDASSSASHLHEWLWRWQWWLKMIILWWRRVAVTSRASPASHHPPALDNHHYNIGGFRGECDCSHCDPLLSFLIICIRLHGCQPQFQRP